MEVIVNSSGFFGGNWFEASKQPQYMPDAVARAFLPPYGDQLALPKVEKTAAAKADEKKVD